MICDTFQVSQTFARSPDQNHLESIGWQPLADKRTREITALCFNGDKDEGKPRLTLSRNRNDLWIIRAETSPGRLLFGSNLHLANTSEIRQTLSFLSGYVEENSRIVFDAYSARVTRVDFARDFHVGENSVIPIISKYKGFDLPKYRRVCFDDSSVYFRNAGRDLTKQYLLYSKHHERLQKGNDISEQERAKGILRLEVSFRKSGVNRLADSLKLENHQARNVLTEAVSEKVFEKAMKVLEFEKMLKLGAADFTELFKDRSFKDASNLLTFLFLRGKFGGDYGKFEPFGINKRTCQRYWRTCRELGVLSLE